MKDQYLSLKEATKYMSGMEKVRLSEGQRFARQPKVPTFLNYKGKKWKFYAWYGWRRGANKTAERIKKHYPGTSFLFIGSRFNLTALYVYRPLWNKPRKK